MKGLQIGFTAIAVLGLSPVVSIAQDDAEIEEITVTGQKLMRSLQQTKESVAVIDAELIESQNLFDLREVFNQTANAFEIGNGENFGIRGITQSSASTGGGTGELGSLYLDGVAFTGFSTRFGPKAMWDVEQVEILRGPQSTNVGRNALIGAVVVTTNNPDLAEFEVAARLEAGNNARFGAEGMVNIPVSDRAALRFTAEHFDTDGFNSNVTQGLDDYDARTNRTYRGKLLFEATDMLTIGVTAQYAETERGQDIYRADLAPVESRTSSANLTAFENYKAFSAALNLDYRINDSMYMTAITSRIDGEYDRFDDDDEGPEGGNAFRGRQAEDENWAQELRLTFERDDMQGVAGVYYTEVDLINDTSGLVNISPEFAGVPAALLPFYPTVLEIDVFSPAMKETTNVAFFTEWDFNISDDWRLSAGFRYDHEEQETVSNTSNTLVAGSELPDPVAAGQLAEQLQPGTGAFVEAGVAQVNALLQSLLTPTANAPESTDYDAFLPQVGATYSVTEDVSLSAFYKRGYRSGGVDVTLTGEVSTYDPEYLDNIEFSLRSTFAEGAVTLNANAYFGDWEDQQVSICPTPATCVTENAGKSEIYGAEVDMTWRISDATQLYASVGFSETEFTDFQSDLQGDLTGNEFALSPNTTAAVGGRVWLTDAIAVGGSVDYVSKSWADVQNSIRLDARTLLNLNARYENDRFAVTAYGKNLTDEFYLTTDAPGIGADARLVRAGAPREYGVLLSVDF